MSFEIDAAATTAGSLCFGLKSRFPLSFMGRWVVLGLSFFRKMFFRKITELCPRFDAFC